ncbi:hypothetical protein [Paraburkholderia sediminicola]
MSSMELKRCPSMNYIVGAENEWEMSGDRRKEVDLGACERGRIH